MFGKTREAMLKLSPSSRRKVAGQVLELLKRRQARQANSVLSPAPSQPGTSSGSRMLTSEELDLQRQARAKHMAYLQKRYPNVRVV